MAWHLMIDSEKILLNAYEKVGSQDSDTRFRLIMTIQSKGKPFAIPTTERWIVFVSDRERVRQFHQESELVLSTEQALHDVCGPKLHISVYVSDRSHLVSLHKTAVGSSPTSSGAPRIQE